MNFIPYAVLITLLAAYAAFVYYQNKKLKVKIGKVLEGKIEDKTLSKLIKRAQSSGKINFMIYLCLLWVVISIVSVIFAALFDLLKKSELDLPRYLVVFLFMVTSLSIGGIINANSIWNLSRSKKEL